MAAVVLKANLINQNKRIKFLSRNPKRARKKPKYIEFENHT